MQPHQPRNSLITNSASPISSSDLRLVGIALLASCVLGAVLMDPVVVAAGLVASLIHVLLRHYGDPPIMSFCLGFQWLFIMTGVIYRDVVGKYPGYREATNIDRAAYMLLLGLLVVAIGIRLAYAGYARLCGRWQDKLADSRVQYDHRKLFLYVLAAYSMSWITSAAPPSGVAQAVLRVLDFRSVFLFSLVVVVLRQRRGYFAVGIATLFVMLPTFTSPMSSFRTVLFIVLLAVLTDLGTRSAWTFDLRRMRRAMAAAVALSVVLVILGVVWQGAVKPAWRPLVMEERVTGSKIERLAEFVDVAADAIVEMDPTASVESLVQRLSDVPLFFGRVLERVPARLPHEDGQQTMEAVRHVLMPRFFFPNKTMLGSDSWLVRTYAGLQVAGAERNTSFGLGYMIEFYIDFGPVWMYAALLVLGAFVGTMNRLMIVVSRSTPLYLGSVATIGLLYFSNLETLLAKLLGGLLSAYIIFGVLFLLFGKFIHRSLMQVSYRGASSSTIRPRLPAAAGGLHQRPGWPAPARRFDSKE